MATTLQIPSGALATATSTTGSGGSLYARVQDADRLLTYGSLVGKNVYKVCELKNQTIAPGAPGTLNLDLMAQVPVGGGAATMVGVAGKLVYLEVVQKSGSSDLAIRVAAATAIAIASGLVDAVRCFGRTVLVDATESTDVLTTAGIAFDATHKNIQFESTAGATFDLLYAVI